MKPGRNQACPCGSGRKYKHCCGVVNTATRPASPPADALRAALAHHRAGRLAQAESYYQQVLQTQPDNCDALHLLGVLVGQRGDTSRAIALIRRALEIRPRFSEAHNNLGSFLQAQGKYDEAMAAYRAALAVRPDYAEAYNNLGNALRLKGGGLSEAVHCYERALELQPGYPEAHLNLGLARYAQGRLEEAAACYRRAVEARPQSADAHHNLGLALQGLGRYGEALTAYRHALSLRPAHAETHNNLGNLLRVMGRGEEAVSSYRHAIDLQPDYPAALCNLALMLSEQDRALEALDHYHTALAHDSDHREARYGVARILHQLGRFDEAETAYREVLRVYPNHPEAYGGLVRCRRIIPGDAPLLEKMESILADPGVEDHDAIGLHLALGKAYDDLGEYSKAISHFQQGNRLQAARCPFDRAQHEARVTALITTYSRARVQAGTRNSDPSSLPVLIVGMPRSGTTLIEQILSRHPQIGAGGELEFWAIHAPALMEDPAPDPQGAAARDYVKHLQGLAPGASRITDKLTTNFLRAGMIHCLLPGARIIHCRRNALDNCLSVYFTRFASSHCYAYDLEDLAYYYEQYLRLMRHWRVVLPSDRFCEVRYEDVVADTEQAARQLIHFCGLAWDPRCLDIGAGERAIRTASKWQARQPVYTTSVERWRHYEPYLGPLMRLRDAAD